MSPVVRGEFWTLVALCGLFRPREEGRGERSRLQLLSKLADTEKLLLTCLLFNFGCSRTLPLYIASKSVLHVLYSVKKCHVPALRAFRGMNVVSIYD